MRVMTPQDAQVNNITSRLPTASSSVFHVQACFAIGATIGPFFSTAFAQSDPTRPYLFFWVPAGVALLTAMQMLHACRGVKEEQFGKSWIDGQTISRGQYGSTGVAIPAQGDQRSFSSTNGSTGESQVLVSSKVVTGRPQSSWGKMSRILTSRAAYLLMAWSFFNVCFYHGANGTIPSHGSHSPAPKLQSAVSWCVCERSHHFGMSVDLGHQDLLSHRAARGVRLCWSSHDGILGG